MKSEGFFTASARLMLLDEQIKSSLGDQQHLPARFFLPLDFSYLVYARDLWKNCYLTKLNIVAEFSAGLFKISSICNSTI